MRLVINTMDGSELTFDSEYTSVRYGLEQGTPVWTEWYNLKADCEQAILQCKRVQLKTIAVFERNGDHEWEPSDEKEVDVTYTLLVRAITWMCSAPDL